MKTLNNIAVMFVFAIIFTHSTQAFGVSSPYWNDNPLILAPGEEANVALNLQNMVGDKDIILRASIKSGGDIATLLDSNLDYSVPIGKDDVNVDFLVNAPKDAKAGDEYIVVISFKQIATTDDNAFLQIAGEVTKSIPVKVVARESAISTLAIDDKNKVSNTLIILAIVLAIIVAIIYYLRLKKKKEQMAK